MKTTAEAQVVVADAGPLIALARAEHLHLLRELYVAPGHQPILIPQAVYVELGLVRHRPGSESLRQACSAGWIVTVEVETSPELASLLKILDDGEAQAILLAEQAQARFLLIDEKRGRKVALRRNLAVVGSGGLLLAAKRKGLVPRIEPILEAMKRNGYRFSTALYHQLLRAAGELEPQHP